MNLDKSVRDRNYALCIVGWWAAFWIQWSVIKVPLHNDPTLFWSLQINLFASGILAYYQGMYSKDDL